MGTATCPQLPKRGGGRRKNPQEVSQEPAANKKPKLSPTTNPAPSRSGHCRSIKPLEGSATVSDSTQRLAKPRKRKPLSKRLTPLRKRSQPCERQDILSGYDEDLEIDVFDYVTSMEVIVAHVAREPMEDAAEMPVAERVTEAPPVEVVVKRELPADAWVKRELTDDLEVWPMKAAKAEDEDVKTWITPAVDNKDLIALGGGDEDSGKKVVVVKQECDPAETKQVSQLMKQEHIDKEDKEIGIGGVIVEGSERLDILDDVLQLQLHNEILQNELNLVRRSWLWTLVQWLA